MKLWGGQYHGETDKTTDDFNSNIAVDCRMAMEDIKGSIAHATMLGECGIIEKSESEILCSELRGIAADLQNGTLEFDLEEEDIHSFVESELTRRCGDTGKRVHTARSRNDQVAVDIRLYLREKCKGLRAQLAELTRALSERALENKDVVMPGYTHLQRAQPITFGHHLMAYAEMFLRDISRLKDAEKRMNICPLGCGALAGTTYPIDRERSAKLLGFDDWCHNSMDGVSDRDFCVEIASAISLAMVHLSRLSAELVLWCSWEFQFIRLDDAFSTGSSIMPQKKNPDIPELVRGKTGRVVGDLTGLLTMMKGLPLAYNKDMQEDKEAIFDAVDTLSVCLTPFVPMVETMQVQAKNMRRAASKGHINATDCADYLVGKGVPFRDAYRVTGDILAYCVDHGMTLETLPLDVYQEFDKSFDEEVYIAVSLDNCVNGRKSAGGPAPELVEQEARRVLAILEEMKKGGE